MRKKAIFLFVLALVGTASQGPTSQGPTSQGPIQNPRTYLFTFKVLTLNTWLLQGLLGIGAAPDRHCRGQDIGLSVGTGDYDVVVLQEIFDKGPSDALYCGAGAAGVCASVCRDKSFRSRYRNVCDPSNAGRLVYPYHQRRYPLGKGLEINGGLGILSKYPILFQHNEPWRDCGGVDCFAQKGFFHARVKHPLLDVPLEIMTLHANANYGGGAKYENARRLELMQARNELDRYPNAPWIVAGDFNIVGTPCSGEACEDVPEYFTLKAALPEFEDAWAVLHPSEYGFTADDRANGNRSGSRQERIDYVWSTDAGTCYELEVADARVEQFKSTICSSPNSSDHFGVGVTYKVYRRGHSAVS